MRLIDEKPGIGVHGVRVAFLDRESTKGILRVVRKRARARLVVRGKNYLYNGTMEFTRA